MRPQNKGFLQEDEVVMSLDKKRYADISYELKPILVSMFGFVDPDDLVYCYKFEDYTKPDFVVEINDAKHYVSMKTTSVYVHQEKIESFIMFLKELGISDKTCETFLKYQYGDGTIDGTGHHRDPYNVVFAKLQAEIQEANRELNADQEIMWKVVRRCLFQGVNEKAIPADYLFMGDSQGGHIISKGQVYKYIRLKDWDFIENLHIGPLLFNPHARYVDKEVPERFNGRHFVDVKWPNLEKDIIYIERKFTGC